MYGLNEELGRNRGRKIKLECSLCWDQYGNVSLVLWEFSVFSSTRVIFMKHLQELLDND